MAYGSHDRQTVLIVDDEMINREILKNLLKDDYAVLEAENGRTALEIMRRDYASINAVLLDVIMPEMGGYEFMQEISDARYENIPIIILTGSASLEEEERALKLGAWDFISKPYQPRILQKRLQNAIARSRMGMLDQMRYLAQHDQLTGLYNRTMFFNMTKKMLAEYADTQFVMVRTDIDQFSLLNSFWGEKGGDDFLRSVADGLAREAEKIPLCTFGRINADIFCMCLPYEEETLMKALTESRQAIMNFRTDYYIKPTYGIYVITERDLSV